MTLVLIVAIVIKSALNSRIVHSMWTSNYYELKRNIMDKTCAIIEQLCELIRPKIYKNVFIIFYS